jgi:predicted nucleic acid-binding protein
MSVYFDASLIVSLFIEDALSARADAYLERAAPTVCVSDFAAAEFASAVNRRVRMGLLGEAEGRASFSEFDVWRRRGVESLTTTQADVAAAETYLRRFDLPLRTPDALNIALAARADLPLATFDAAMARCAKALGVPLEAV